MGDRPARSLDVSEHLCVLRGGGDLATGAAWRLTKAGFPVVVCELAKPLTVRRTVALSSAVLDARVDIEGMVGHLAISPDEAVTFARRGEIGVVVSPALPEIDHSVVVDARLAKRNIDTTLTDASLVIGLGPGFTASENCHAVIETARGHHLGRVSWSGTAAPDTGTPGVIDGKGASRVLRAPADGLVTWNVAIAETVEESDIMGEIDGRQILAPFSGVVRGLISPETTLHRGLKIGDIDPRADRSACFEISDKSLAIGGGVLEAVLTWLNQNS